MRAGTERGASEGLPRPAMDAPRCMKALLLAAAEYRAARTAHNAALLQRSLEVGAAPGPARGRGGTGAWDGGACGVCYTVFLCVYRRVLWVCTHPG